MWIGVAPPGRGGGTFTDEEFSSNDGMQTAVWGPIFWTTIHMCSFNYPVHPTPEAMQDYRTFLESIGRVLPCRYCRDNFPGNMTRAGYGPHVFDSRDTFSRFCHRLHNEVNTMLHKNDHPSFDTVRDRYEAFRSRCLTSEQEAARAAQSVELGCTNAKYEGTKSKCQIRILPRDEDASSFVVHDRCVLRPVDKLNPAGSSLTRHG